MTEINNCEWLLIMLEVALKTMIRRQELLQAAHGAHRATHEAQTLAGAT
jgi:hypothetical protein